MARRLAACVVSLALFGSLAAAQDSATAVLVGRVTDPSGAPVVGARVKAVREGTGLSREGATDASGSYLLTSLAPSAYTVAVEASGFAPRTFPGVAVGVGRRVTLDAALAVDGGSEAVTVEDRAPALDTTSSVVGDVLSSSAIGSLPLNGRNFLELALLVPGNAPAPTFDPTKSEQRRRSPRPGQLGRGGNITIDGQDNNDDVVGGPLQNCPQESVQEFQIATNRFSGGAGPLRRVGHQRGDQVGHRPLHGSASHLRARRDWQGLPATYDRTHGDRSALRSPAVLGGAGGPLVRGRVFWFGAVEFRNQDGAVLVGARDTADAHDPAHASRRRRSTTTCWPRARGLAAAAATTS